jgi:hypothetical protein
MADIEYDAEPLEPKHALILVLVDISWASELPLCGNLIGKFFTVMAFNKTPEVSLSRDDTCVDNGC